MRLFCVFVSVVLGYATSSFGANDKACDVKALKIVKNIVRVTHDGPGAYSVERSKSSDADTQYAVTVHVGTGGEDSDTYLDYELVFSKTAISKECATLESVTLVHENY